MGGYGAFAVTLIALVVTTWAVAKSRALVPATIVLENPRREALVVLVPTAILFVFTITLFASLASGGASAPPSDALADDSYTLGQALVQLGLNLVIVIPFAATMAIRRQRPASAGLTRQHLLSALSIGAVAGMVAVASNGKLSPAFWSSSDTLLQLLAQLGVGFSEETIFRGYLHVRFSIWLGRRAWVLTAAIFAVWHVPQLLASGVPPAGMARHLVALFAWGLAYDWSMRRMGNVTGLALLHAIMNVVGDV
jgi:membrane protease YdiL (CAAX protease family)